MSFLILKNQKFKDKSGETVWFPKDEKPYFDQGFRRTFNSIKEKADFMNSKGIISDGSSDGHSSTKRKKVEIAREVARESARISKNKKGG